MIPGHAPDPNIDDQHHLQALLDSDLWSSLKDDSSLRDRARINTISAQHAGAWLSALPNPNLGLAMPSKEFIVVVRLRLGLTFFPGSPQSILCPCGAVLDKFSDHLLGCDQKTNDMIVYVMLYSILSLLMTLVADVNSDITALVI